jgi:hypothetical protein
MTMRTFLRHGQSLARFVFILMMTLIVSLFVACFVAQSARGQTFERIVLADADSALWYGSMDTLADQVGVREATGRNDGYMVRQYLFSTGLGSGHPWCQAVQYWALRSWAIKLRMSPSRIPILRTASTQAAYDDARRRGVVTRVTKPHEGDLMVWRSFKGYTGHVGRIVARAKGGWVRTREGNTSSGTGNQRDGDGFYERYRNIYHRLSRMYVRGFIGLPAYG